MSDPILKVIEYHEKTKHSFEAYAAGPDYLDWETQPDPFRRYDGAPLIPLDKTPVTDEPTCDAALVRCRIAPAPLNKRSVSQLFFDCLSISAWKSTDGETWALRVDPSSGNLHPTEGYLICGGVEGLSESPMVCHYAPKEHALEVRAEIPPTVWERLAGGLPGNTLLLGVTSVHWREAWKYGERAYRYCQHDVGHVLGGVAVAAAGLGWQVRLLDNLSTEQLSLLLGVSDAQEAEHEAPDCLLAIWPEKGDSPLLCEAPSRPFRQKGTVPFFSDDALREFAKLSWKGKPNKLSPSNTRWPLIEAIAGAACKPPTSNSYEQYKNSGSAPKTKGCDLPLRRIIRQRRSAQAMDGETHMPRAVLYRMLSRTLPRFGQFPFTLLPWPPNVHLVLFVHRVEDLPPGLYFLARNPREKAVLQATMKGEFVWTKPDGCAKGLDLYLLEEGDARRASMMLSCSQDIASDGCFSLAMIARFGGPLERYGAWFYPRLYWECGMIGQVLYLEAEAAGLRGTGIGCFFDDPVHETLGLQDEEYQDLYHFTVGAPVEDSRITMLPAYPD